MNDSKNNEIMTPEDIFKNGISFSSDLKSVDHMKEELDKFKNINNTIVKEKIESIEVGKLATVIYGDFSNQKVINGKVMSITDASITMMSKEKEDIDPVVIPFDKIMDIYEVKKFKRKQIKLSIFKLNEYIKEFFGGTEDEIKEAFKRKISVKKLRKQLKDEEDKKAGK